MVEIQCICYILESGSIKGFKADWFIDCRAEFDYINGFVQKYGKVPDKVTFVSKFRDFKIFQVTDPLSSLVERLKEEARYKKIIPAYNKAYDLISEGKSDEACKLLVDHITKLEKDLSQGLPPVDLSDPETKKSLYRQHKSGVTKFPTGRPELDAQFGGWNSKDYVVIFARLGIGKSWIAEFFAYCLVKSGKRVGYYSGEMSAVEVSLRLDTFNTNQSNGRMFNGNMSDDDYSKVADSFSDLPGKFYVLTPEELGGAASVDDLKRFIENQRLEALFIDQFSLLKRNSKLGATEASAKLAEDLRVLQSITGVPFFIVSQQNRQSLQDKDSKSKDDFMASISLTDALGQNATLAFGLDYNQDNRVLTLNLAKNRRGKPGKFSYYWGIDTGELRYIPSVEDDGSPVDDSDDGWDEPNKEPF